MFSPQTQGSQRCNGVVLSLASDKNGKTRVNNNKFHNKLVKLSDVTGNYDKNDWNNSDVSYIKKQILHHNSKFNNVDTEVKIEPADFEFDDTFTTNSIIGLSDIKEEERPVVTPQVKKGSLKATHHEILERIDPIQMSFNHYQKNWFSASLEKFNVEDHSREERIEITRHEFRRHLYQIMRSNIGQNNKPAVPERDEEDLPLSSNGPNSHRKGYCRLVAPKLCEIERCDNPALPCTKHCTAHIMHNTEQYLFEYCTAKFSDNTQCSAPVFDIFHELPLCPEHARKRDNYHLYQETKPKKVRRKVKPSAMIRPQKRNKKKRKSNSLRPNEIYSRDSPILDHTTSVIVDDVDNVIETESPELVEDMHIVDQVLGLNEADALGQEASHLLEETDITNVLSTIQADEFSDFFTVDRNGVYEPSREEAEELEKALAAVDNDVKSLEKLSQSQGLLDSLLDEHALAETLVQIPDVFHNGYATCGDSMVPPTSSYLLPVEPHSHS